IDFVIPAKAGIHNKSNNYNLKDSCLRRNDREMDLKEKLLSSFLVFENQLEDDAYMIDVRNEAIKTFEEKGFPSKKEESWKYTSLNSVLKADYNIFPKQENSIEFNDVKKYFIHDID